MVCLNSRVETFEKVGGIGSLESSLGKEEGIAIIPVAGLLLRVSVPVIEKTTKEKAEDFWKKDYSQLIPGYSQRYYPNIWDYLKNDIKGSRILSCISEIGKRYF